MTSFRNNKPIFFGFNCKFSMKKIKIFIFNLSHDQNSLFFEWEFFKKINSLPLTKEYIESRDLIFTRFTVYCFQTLYLILFILDI